VRRIDHFRLRWLLPEAGLALSGGLLHRLEEALAAAEAAGGLIPPVADGDSANDIIGQASAYIMVSWLDAAVAQACLLPNVELAPPPGTPAGKHPVMYTFGSQLGVRPRYALLGLGDDYNETVVGLPCVNLRHSDGTASGPYFQMTALRVDSAVADEIGVALGFPKEIGIIGADDTTYDIWMPPNPFPVMTGTFSTTANAFGPDFPNFQTIEPMLLRQPVISRAPDGSFLLTQFNFDTSTAVMFTAEAAFTIADNSIAALPAGNYAFPGIDVMAFGGCFHSVHNWSMSPPVPIAV
jgi:hypothetical protein